MVFINFTTQNDRYLYFRDLYSQVMNSLILILNHKCGCRFIDKQVKRIVLTTKKYVHVHNNFIIITSHNIHSMSCVVHTFSHLLQQKHRYGLV